MRIDCPYCGARDQGEFSYLGDAAPRRPTGAVAPETDTRTTRTEAMFDYVYIRDNPAGRLRELWYHAFGCRAWLEVTRDVRTHEIVHVIADDAADGTTVRGDGR